MTDEPIGLPAPLVAGTAITIDPATAAIDGAAIMQGRTPLLATILSSADPADHNRLADWVATVLNAVLTLRPRDGAGPLMPMPRGLEPEDVQILHEVAEELAEPGSRTGIGGEPAADAPACDWDAWACRAVIGAELARREGDPLYQRHWLIAAAAALIAEIEALDRALEDAARVIAATPAEAGAQTAIGSVRRCRVCGCTEDRACPGGCWWVGADLCSACAEAGATPAEA